MIFVAVLLSSAALALVITPAARAIAAGLVIGAGATIDRVTLAGGTYELGVAAIPVTLAWIVTITNAFNLVDGLDGLAVIAAATCALILVARGHTSQALLLVGLLGAIIGFLPYNSHPASIFLGDSGSLVIGFVLAVTAITGWQKGATVLAAGVPLLIFAVPILDTVTLQHALGGIKEVRLFGRVESDLIYETFARPPTS